MFDYADSNKDGKISYQVSLMSLLYCRSYNQSYTLITKYSCIYHTVAKSLIFTAAIRL